MDSLIVAHKVVMVEASVNIREPYISAILAEELWRQLGELANTMSDVGAAILGLELKETAEKAEDVERQAQHQLGEAKAGSEHAAFEAKKGE